MRVMTANVRNADRADDGHAWDVRKDACTRVIAACAPDVLGLQEATIEQVEAVAAAMPDHTWLGLRQNPLGHPRNAVLIHRSFTVTDRGGYWLSPTPHVPGSIGWDARYPRHVNWVVLAGPDGGHWRVSNTHLDHECAQARAGAARLLAEDTAAWPTESPQVLMGDFNTVAGSAPLTTLECAGWRDAWAAAHPDQPDSGPTRHGFGRAASAHPQRIDWIMVRGPTNVHACEVVRDRPDGMWPSDHYFMWADVEAVG